MIKNRYLLFYVLAGLVLSSGLAISNKTTEVSAEATHDHTGYTAWSTSDELPSSSGSYYLTCDVTLDACWNLPNQVNLCLNGYVIKIASQDCNGIVIDSGETLNLYDCGSNVHYFDKDASGLWTLASDQSTPTEFSITGGCITGVSSVDEFSAVLCDGGTFNMYGGNIVGNKGPKGAGVNNLSYFNMYGGKIIGNVSSNNGGGVYVSSSARCILMGGEITDNVGQNGSGVCFKGPACFAAGTQITMADGTRQAIEDLEIGDLVRVFNHDKGEIASNKLFDVGKYYEQQDDVVALHFTNDINVTVVYGHSFFEREENRYVSVTKDNVSKYVDHQFYNADNSCWETLTGYDFIDGKADTYYIASEYTLNCIANGMLSVEDGAYTAFSNVFDFQENLKIDDVKKAQDIEKYGIYKFDNISHISKYTYDVLGLENLNVAFGKGLISEARFNYLEAFFGEAYPEVYGVEEEQPLTRTMRTSVVPLPVDNGLYLGGSIKIKDNKDTNLFVPNESFINIGTGTTGSGNGVPAPDNMEIGITLQSGKGQFTTTGVGDCASNFFSDNNNYAVRFNNKGNNDTSDDILELIKPITIINNVKVEDKNTNNGYIDVLSTAAEGDTVTLTVVPNSHYMLTENSLVVSYNDGEEKTADLVEGEDSEYTFTVPGYDVNISAAFEQNDEHVFSEVPSKLSTCTENGYKKAYYCSTCDQYFEDYLGEQRIGDLAAYEAWKEGDGKSSALGHVMVHHDAKEPTCTEAGWEAFDTCSTCDYSTYIEISALGHPGALVEGLDPTYENDGYKPAYKCSTCGEYFEDQGCTKLIGDEAAYNAWKANAGHLDKLAKEEPAKSNTGLIVGATCGGTFFLLLLVYTSCYFFLYRKGKLDARKLRVIYKFLPRGNKNLEE